MERMRAVSARQSNVCGEVCGQLDRLDHMWIVVNSKSELIFARSFPLFAVVLVVVYIDSSCVSMCACVCVGGRPPVGGCLQLCGLHCGLWA